MSINYNIPYVLFDVRQRNYIEFSDQNWLIEEIFPLLKGVLRKAAYLTEFESFKLFDTLRLQETMDACSQENSFKIEHFLNENQAIDWLFS